MVDPVSGRANVRPSREAWFAALVLRYRQPLVRYFIRKGVPIGLAEDCTQEVFLRLVRTDEQTIQNSEAYLFTIASSVLVSWARKVKSHREAQHCSLEDCSLVSGEATPDRVLEGREALLRLASALSELPADTLEMFLLNREDGLTYTQIAARYAIGVKAVERHIILALNHIRLRFPRHE
jgi:RNA polymerase sigma-70 factor (ECF subfamily)